MGTEKEIEMEIEKEKGRVELASGKWAKLGEKLMAFGWCCVHLTFWQSMPPINRSLATEGGEKSGKKAGKLRENAEAQPVGEESAKMIC